MCAGCGLLMSRRACASRALHPPHPTAHLGAHVGAVGQVPHFILKRLEARGRGHGLHGGGGLHCRVRGSWRKPRGGQCCSACSGIGPARVHAWPHRARLTSGLTCERVRACGAWCACVRAAASWPVLPLQQQQQQGVHPPAPAGSGGPGGPRAARRCRGRRCSGHPCAQAAGVARGARASGLVAHATGVCGRAHARTNTLTRSLLLFAPRAAHPMEALDGGSIMDELEELLLAGAFDAAADGTARALRAGSQAPDAPDARALMFVALQAHFYSHRWGPGRCCWPSCTHGRACSHAALPRCTTRRAGNTSCWSCSTATTRACLGCLRRWVTQGPRPWCTHSTRHTPHQRCCSSPPSPGFPDVAAPAAGGGGASQPGALPGAGAGVL